MSSEDTKDEGNTGFTYMFWGFLFLLGFRVHGINLLPDIVGYILIFTGLGHLLKHVESENFSSARTVVKPLIVLSAINIYDFYEPSQNQWVQVVWERHTFLMVIMTILSSALVVLSVYYICMGISSWAESLNIVSLQKKASDRWLIFLAMHIFVLTVLAVAYTMQTPGQLFILLAPAAVFILVTHILLMTLMKEAREVLTCVGNSNEKQCQNDGAEASE